MGWRDGVQPESEGVATCSSSGMRAAAGGGRARAGFDPGGAAAQWRGVHDLERHDAGLWEWVRMEESTATWWTSTGPRRRRRHLQKIDTAAANCYWRNGRPAPANPDGTTRRLDETEQQRGERLERSHGVFPSRQAAPRRIFPARRRTMSRSSNGTRSAATAHGTARLSPPRKSRRSRRSRIWISGRAGLR